jgi:transposase
MKRKVYTLEFKNQAVQLVKVKELSVKQVAIQLEMHENSLYRWIQEVEKYDDNALPGQGSLARYEQIKIKKLEKENRRLQEELDLLKNFQVFVKKGHK